VPHAPAPRQGPAWAAHVLTLFPEMFPGPLAISLAGSALSAGLWSLAAHDIRDHGIGRHRTVDDHPAGGGAGMVLRCDVVAAALDATRRSAGSDLPLIYMTPRGAPLTQARVAALAAGPGAVLIAGRFEGLDERAIAARGLEEISIGDYVLAGGELAAMVLIEGCVRLLPGVLGAAASLSEESFADGLLEYPQYTRPRAWEGHTIPDVLLSGDHKAIANWRQQEALRLTELRRPDLIARRATKRNP
jgi:tRNA (guanine37-N1)-methyltransferase